MMCAPYLVKLLTFCGCVVCLLTSGCGRSTLRGDARVKKLQELQAKRQATAARLKQMDVNQLAAELESDSRKGVEPFNSMSFSELLSRRQAAVQDLQRLITKPDRSSLLALLALRKLDESSYKSLSPSFRVMVLVDALKKSTYFNTWGIPTDYWNDAARAIIAEGSPAVTALVPLLRDTRPALIWGSEGAVASRQYHFRVCDYAWALVNETANRKITMPENPETRDELIRETLKQLEGQK
jgi:hypothetical protein